jgi:hypothetical protein
MIDLAVDIIPLTTKGFSTILTDAITPPRKITDFPIMKISGGVHSVRNLLAISLVAPKGVELSTISFASMVTPTP